MLENKYGNFLTILLVIVIIAIIGLLGFGGYTVYQQFNSTKDANEFVNSFLEQTQNNINNNQQTNTNISLNTNTDVEDPFGQVENTPSGGGTSSGGKEPTFQGYTAIGTIEIPKINLSYPILKETSKSALERSVSMLYGPGPNQPGNTYIIGHNYRDGRFFANNKNLSIGDKVYITDLSGKRLSYTIYNKFETTEEDTTFLTRNTNGAREISLQTCTDNGLLRLILLAKCDLDS